MADLVMILQENIRFLHKGIVETVAHRTTQFSLHVVPRRNFHPVWLPTPAVLLSGCLFSSYRVSHVAYPFLFLAPVLGSSELNLWSNSRILIYMHSFCILNSPLTLSFLICPYFPFFSSFFIHVFLILNCCIIRKYKLHIKSCLQ